jgi:hypothetical protein
MYGDEVPKLVTPGTLAQGVREALERLPAACTHCGASAWTTPDGAKVKCGACGKDAAYPDGDAILKEWLQRVAREKGLFGG